MLRARKLSLSTINPRLSYQACKLISKIEVFKRLESTNAYLSSHPAPQKDVLVCIADSQTQGRGRRGNSWVSPPASNIYLSVRWFYSSEPDNLSTLSLACGVSIVGALEKLKFKNLKLKWPNDIFAGGKKLGGILIERKNSSGGLVIGVGINCAMPANLGERIDQEWTNLYEHGDRVDRGYIIAEILNKLLPTLEKHPQTNFSALKKNWRRYDLLINRPVTTTKATGIAAGIDKTGGLIIRGTNKTTIVNSGEVSINNPNFL